MHLLDKEELKNKLMRHFKKSRTAPNIHNKSYPIHYLKRLIKERELHEEIDKSINLRNDILEKQKIGNYTNELNRIRGEMSRSIFKGQTIEKMEARKRHLIKMGAEDII
jgi:hypothetical protein